MLLFVAHPDDEVIFLAPLLEFKPSIYKDETEKTDEIPTVVCMTCKDDPIRSKEFAALAAHVGFRAVISDIPIARGLSFKNFSRILELVRSNVSPGTKECSTHSLYGDDHFHPQHILLCIAVTYVCIKKGLRLTVADSNCSTAQLFFKAVKRTDWKRFKSILLLPVKLFLIMLHKIVFAPGKLRQADQLLLDRARLIYASQSLEYPSLVSNLYRFSTLRKVWRPQAKSGDKI